MNSWEIGTWLAVIILGPGAFLVFAAFLWGVRKIIRELEKEGSGDGKGNDGT